MIKPGFIVIAGVIIVGAILLLPYFGIDLASTLRLESTPEGTEDCSYDARDIHAALSVLTGKALPWGQTEPYINSLHMKLCGVDGKNFNDVAEFYIAEWSDGYTSVLDSIDYRSSYTTRVVSYFDGSLTIKTVVAGSGAGVTSYYGHDTMFITASGPATTYYSFVTFINSV